MSGMTVKLGGFAALEKRLNEISREHATKIGQSANRAGAVEILKQAKAQAPVGPTAEGAKSNRHRKGGSVVEEIHHKIANWLRVKKVRAPEGRVESAVTVSKAYHAYWVEFGSVHNAPNPFMKRALDTAQQAAIDRIAAVLEKRLTKAGV